MAISAAQVKELRNKTGLGMMQCKKALTETDGDMEKAIEELRKHGAAVAAKRADRAANEGVVLFSETAEKIIVAEINCETEPVAASDDFKALSKKVMGILDANDNVADVPALLAIDGLGEKVTEVIGKIGENIGVKHFAQIAIASNECAATYSHMGGKIGVVVKVSYEGTPSDEAALKASIRDICMQVAATNPSSVSEADLDQDVLAKEAEIYKLQAIEEGKTPEIAERMIGGRIKKYIKEVCLSEQVFVKDSKKTILDVLKETASAVAISDLKIVSFTRMELGK